MRGSTVTKISSVDDFQIGEEVNKVIQKISFRPSDRRLSSLPCDGFAVENLIWKTNIIC